jgi:maltose O-acetyltransferase
VSLRNALLNEMLATRFISRTFRARAYRRLGMRLGDVRIGAGAVFSGTNVTIGDGTFINYGCFIDGAGAVAIGKNCDLGQSVSIHTVTHEIADATRRAGKQRVLPTTIGDGVWIGAGARVLPGVTVGSGCVIAAGSLVTRDCDPDGLYVGSPAKRVRSLVDG